MMPLGTARPKAWVAWSTSPQVQPPPTRTVLGYRIDVRVADEREIDDQAVIADPQPSGVVPAAPDRNEETVLAGEVDRRDDIGHIGAARDQGGMLVDHAVVDFAGRIVALITGLDEFSPQARFQRAGVEVVSPLCCCHSVTPCVNYSSSLLMVERMKLVFILALDV